jgi:glutamyl-tRNA(Gln) amidotransferase subunit E
LEEDSARKLKSELTTNGEIVTWNLDRLGIPLVEIATEPEIKSPEHAKSTALKLGTILRDTRMVRRGLGTIRQDLNVSIACGDRVEIKGCQDLEWIPRIIRLEMARQLHFYRIANELRISSGLPQLSPDRKNDSIKEKIKVEKEVDKLMPLEVVDVSTCFSSTEAKLVQNSLSNGGVVMAIRLAGFSGILGNKELDSEGAQLPRLGRELSAAAKVVGVKGIFHSDELPAYGISETEVQHICKKLNLVEKDAFVLCVAPEWQAQLALESVMLRARASYHRIRQEVRNVVIRKGEPEDGTTTAMRPLPGGARMYPETDIPPIILDSNLWQNILSSLPPSTNERLANLSDFDISDNQAIQLVSQHLDEELVKGTDGTLMKGISSLSSKGWASLLLDSTRKEIAEKIQCTTNDVPLLLLAALQHARDEGNLTREGIIPLAVDMLNTTEWPHANKIDSEIVLALVDEITNRSDLMGYKPASSSELSTVVKQIIESRIAFVKERGLGALGPLMGLVMKEFGGGADGKQVSALLKEEIENIIRE